MTKAFVGYKGCALPVSGEWGKCRRRGGYRVLQDAVCRVGFFFFPFFLYNAVLLIFMVEGGRFCFALSESVGLRLDRYKFVLYVNVAVIWRRTKSAGLWIIDFAAVAGCSLGI